MIYTLIVITTLLLLWPTKKTKSIFKQKPSIKKFTQGKASIIWPNPNSTEVAGAGCGVAINKTGDVVYLQRVGHSFFNDTIIPEPVVFVIDVQTQKVKTKWGANQFKAPHSITIDNQDNVWISDTTLNKVFKFDSNGTLLMSFGKDYSLIKQLNRSITLHRPKLAKIRNRLNIFNYFNLPFLNNPYYFAMPTGIVVSDNGDFTVADGYINSRVAKFDAKGKLIWQVRKLGIDKQSFHLPHGIAQDNQGQLYIADRANARIQVFSKEGDWVASWDDVALGRPFSVQVGPDQLLYVVDGGDILHGQKNDLRSQVIVMSLTGEIIKRWGVWGAR
ncbi:hypothetical protein [Marinicellulosiphila megalodicopiae]|uniref:hypothetical protein n=1 Tax=Marinicellulosiphila megalodicopiae TaxID=2724896 RepID=UPI003BB1E620